MKNLDTDETTENTVSNNGAGTIKLKDLLNKGIAGMSAKEKEPSNSKAEEPQQPKDNSEIDDAMTAA